MNPITIVEQCYNRLPDNLKEKPWEVTNHGTKVLQSDDELNAYIAAYGEMHIIKCRAALQNFPFEDIRMHSYEIFDWGCGQGLATLTLLEMLYDRGLLSYLERIFLIEPSVYSLNRAKAWVSQYAGPGIEVVPVNSFIPSEKQASMDSVFCSSSISINLFSNILDLKSISLAWLANKTSGLANTNYMVCVGPKFTQSRNTRLNDFCGYFRPSSYFTCIDEFPYNYTLRTHHPYGCEARTFVHKRGTSLKQDYKEVAEEANNYDPYDYSTEVLKGIVDEKILNFYNRLRLACGTKYDVYFRPDINCDSADFIVASKHNGVVVINVCNELGELENVFDSVEAVKNNLFSVHLHGLRAHTVLDKSTYSCIKTALFFPNNDEDEISNKIKEINEETKSDSHAGIDYRTDKFQYLSCLTLSTDLYALLQRLFSKTYKPEYYEELVSLLSQRWHSYMDGDQNLKLSRRQLDIVRSLSTRLRVKGVAGCGKTQVVANRAVEQHLRTGERVLILTYNISLIQYIRMKICQVPADFSPNKFEVINYHQFFKSKASLYSKRRPFLNSFDDPQFFETCKDRIRKYKSIIIDEAQDFKESWIQLIIKYFLADDGSVSVFGDGEQNIYDRFLEAETKMPQIRDCGFSGRWNEMSERISMRILNPEIASLCSDFSNTFLGSNEPLLLQNSLLFEDYQIKYWNIGSHSKADQIAQNILWIMQTFNINAEDVAILSHLNSTLRRLEQSYKKYTNNEATMTTFETEEQFNALEGNPQIEKILQDLRRTARTHFTTSCEAIKISTIHSFKGWESNTVILILNPATLHDEYEKGIFTPALLYTALTRAKCNLFILNRGNTSYDNFFRQHVL